MTEMIENKIKELKWILKKLKLKSEFSILAYI